MHRTGKLEIQHWKGKRKNPREEAYKPGASHNVPHEKRCQNARHIYYIERGESDFQVSLFVTAMTMMRKEN